MSQNIVDLLNRQIANWGVLFIKLHNYHWNVKGPQFFTLHTKFEELYNEAALHIDELAERALALGGRPTARMSQYLEIASVKEATDGESAEEMVQSIVNDYGTMIGELEQGMAAAGEANDETTADMFLGIKTELEKHVWMLRSFLK